jgi:hypothetical protein
VTGLLTRPTAPAAEPATNGAPARDVARAPEPTRERDSEALRLAAFAALALAIGLEALVGALAGERFGAVLVVAQPESDPVPALRERAAGRRLPGDR